MLSEVRIDLLLRSFSILDGSRILLKGIRRLQILIYFDLNLISFITTTSIVVLYFVNKFGEFLLLRNQNCFNIEIDWGASLVLHTRGYPYSILLPFFEGEISKKMRPGLGHHLTDVYHPFYRFSSDFKVEK